MKNNEIIFLIEDAIKTSVEKYLDQYLYKKTRENLKIHIENTIERGDIFAAIKAKVENIINQMFEGKMEGRLRELISKHFPPNIIYVTEQSKIPPELSNFPVKEYFLGSAKPCIYFLCRDDRIVYIGKTLNINSRLGAHVSLKGFDRVFYMEVDKEDLDRIEKELILYYDPELNKTLMNRKKNARTS